MTVKNRISVSLDDKEYQEINELAQEHNVSVAWLGRQGIIRLLEQHKQREFQFPLTFPKQTKAADS